jgi:hypothetical protein
MFTKKLPIILLTCLLSALTLFINSCKKENNTTASLVETDEKVVSAKSWYESNYPKRTAQAGQLATNSSEKSFDLSQLINPDWANAINYERFNDDVLEMPIDPSTNVRLGIDNAPNKAVSNTKSSFLLIKHGNTYKAYVMSVIADADYLKGDTTRLNKNKYNKRDNNFSGYIYYSTPEGKFVSGWYYKNGRIQGKVQKYSETGNTSSKDGKSTQNIEIHKSGTLTICVVWFQWGTGGVQYLDTRCHDVTVEIPELDLPPSGGEYGTPTSGSGDGNNSDDDNENPDGPEQPPIPDCVVQVSSMPDGKVVINNTPRMLVYDNGGGSGGGGGFPPPEAPDCPEESPKKVTIDPSITNNQKMNCIMAKLGLGTNPAVTKFLAQFMESSKYNVTIKLADGNYNGNAHTVFFENNPNVTIEIKSSYINSSPTAADIARTVLHEMAHTYLAQMIINAGGPSNLKTNLDQDYQALFDQYTKFVDPITGLYKATANDDAQHEFMGERLINDIANGLKAFVELNTPVTKNDPYVTLDNYKALAWKTLWSTEAYAKFKAATNETNDSQNNKINQLNSATTNDCN